MTHDAAMETLSQALSETMNRNEFSTPMLRSIEFQLNYAIQSLNHENDRSRLKDIIFHRYAAREIEEEEYADCLHYAYDVVKRMMTGEL